jgi:transposase
MRHPNQGKVSDEEIIEAYRQMQSTKAVCDRFGLSVQTVCRRKREIERKRGLVLPVADHRPAYNTAEIDHSRAVYKLGVTDGTILIGSDFHVWPGERTTMQRAFIQFAAMLKPVAVIANGDVFDGASISRFPSIGWEAKPSVKAELEAVSDFLGDVVKAAGKAKRIWNLGNHDSRFESRIAANAPEFAGVKGVHLKDHFEQWTPAWRCDINDDVVVKHRGVGGEHADWNNVLKSGMTFVTGHDHRLGVVPYHDYRGIRFGVRTGYMAESPMDAQFVNYLEASMPNWIPGFAVLTFKDGRLLWPEIVNKHADGIVQFRGQLHEV